MSDNKPRPNVPNWAKYAVASSVCFGVNPQSASAEQLVFLDATGLDEGPLETWRNFGTTEGDFVSAGDTTPEVTTVNGVRTVSLIGGTGGPGGTHYVGPTAPESVTDSGTSRTIEAWIYNPDSQAEETIFSWSRRGGPDGTNVSFNHGTNGTFGALGQWGADADVGWNGEIVFGAWTFIAYTYDADSTTTRVFKDGVLVNEEEHGISLLPFDEDTNGNPIPFRVGRQINADGTLSGVGVGAVNIARLRVHDEALEAETIAGTFEEEKDAFGLGDSDGDGLDDGYENNYDFLDPNNGEDAALDQDEDGLTNLEEFENDTDPSDPDSDNDGALDGAEVNRMVDGVAAPTNPLSEDTDGDGVLDGAETGTGEFVSSDDTGSDPLVVDTDGDDFPDGQEVSRGSDPNRASSVPNLDEPVISLDATDLSEGELGEWSNDGVAGGSFVAGDTGSPVVETFQGVSGVSFDGTTYMTGPNAPASLTGNASRTIEAWVMNPSAADEETIFAWGRRGGPDGSNMSFNHGVNATWGAIGHWGAPDIGWDGTLVQGNWTYVAYTWDSEDLTTTVYTNGDFAATETLEAPLNTHAVDDGGNPLPFRVASQSDANGVATGALRGSMLIGRIRVHERTLTDNEISANFENDSIDFGLGDLDNDGMPTWYENQYDFLSDDNPDDAFEDADEDGLDNDEEFELGSDPSNPDSDGDGALDGVEDDLGSDLTIRDTDLDGLLDGVETATEEFVDLSDTGTFPDFDDTDLDGFFDGEEVFYGSDPNDGSDEPDFDQIVAIVDLNAAGLDLGPLPSWPNSGAMGQSFDEENGSAPEVIDFQGVRAVSFDGASQHLVGPTAPLFIAGNFPKSIDAWVRNESAQGEETVFAFGRRGGPEGTNIAFSHGNNPTWGAVGIWGEPDIGWDDNPDDDFNGVVEGAWTHIAFTYDPESLTTTVYRDGEVANTEELIVELDIFSRDNTANERPLPFRVGAQNNADGSVDADPGRLASLLVGRIRAYTQALSPEDIQALYDDEKDSYVATVAPEFSVAVASFDSNGLTLTWDAADGFTYAVDTSEDLEAWTPAATGLTEGSYSDSVPAGIDARFYRVRAE